MDILIPPHTRERYGDELDLDAITESDRKLKMAWQILNDETCKQCGNPIWICRSTNNNIGFNVDSTTCYAQEAIDTYKKNNPGVDSGTAKTFFAKPFTYVDGTTLPSRQDYMELQARSVEE